MAKIAISNLAWCEQEDEQVFQLMAKSGISNLEISPFRDSSKMSVLSKKSALGIKTLLQSFGIRVVALQSLLYRFPKLVLFSDEALLEETFKHLIKIINFADDVGAKTLVLGSPKNKLRGKMEYDKAFNIATHFFQRLSGYLYEHKINLCIEPTPANYGADFIRNTEEAISLIKAVDNSAIKLNMDVGALITNKENIEKSILTNVHYIGHIHISEPFLKIISADYSFHNKVAQAIRKSSYNGVISIEMLSTDTNNIQIIKDTLSFVSKVYN